VRTAGAGGAVTTTSVQEKPVNIDTPWTDFAITRLRQFWDEGLSTAEIGRRLNISRNSVIGKAHRLHLPARMSPIKPKADRPQMRSDDPPVARPSATLPKLSCLRPAATAPAGTRERASLRHSGQCCWPIGDPGTPRFRFCDTAAIPGKPYCEAHARMAYLTRSSRSENNERRAAVA
jgi:GcrA cell cycle regulator